MAFFEGEYSNKIDGKGRTSLPASFRAQLGASDFKGIVIFKSLEDACFIGSTLEYLQDLFARVSRQFGPNSRQLKLFRRNIFAKARRMGVDDDGRMVMPRALKDQIGIKDQILYVGGGDRFEMWQPDAYGALDGATDIAETLDAWNSLDPDPAGIRMEDIFGKK